MYRKTTLENGIRVLTEKLPGTRSVALGVLVDAGPRDEGPGQDGLAHLTEHLMFQGTGRRDAVQIARDMDVSGGQVGAFTTRDYTCYHATVLDDYLTYALDLFGDLLLNSTFPDEHLRREKQAILSEIAAGWDSPAERANNLLKAAVWPGHALGRPVAGTPETVSRLTREEVIYFVHENYLPGRLILAAAGSVEHDDFVAQVRDAFWRLLGGSRLGVPSQPVRHGALRVESRPLSQVYFCLGLPAFAYVHADRYVLHALNSLLGGGISSRLFRRVREERGLAYHIGSEYHAYRDDGLLVIEGSTTPECLLPVLALTLGEVGRLVTGEEPAGEEELWKVKMQIRGQHLIGGESTHTRMSRLLTQEFYFGHALPADEVLAAVEAVDAAALGRLADDLFRDALGSPALAIVGPDASEHYDLGSLEDLVAHTSSACGAASET